MQELYIIFLCMQISNYLQTFWSYPKLLEVIQAYLDITFFSKRLLKQNPNKTKREDKIDNWEFSGVGWFIM